MTSSPHCLSSTHRDRTGREVSVRHQFGLAGIAAYEGMQAVLAGFADLLAARQQLVALTLHEALGGWRTLPLPTAGTPPFPQLRELYERGQREGVFRPDCPFEIAHGVAMSALVGSVVLRARGAAVIDSAGLGADPARLGDQIVGQLLDGMTGRPQGACEGIRP